LNEGLRQSCLLTLVCAPAGYGKTTLVSKWLQDICDAQTAESNPPQEQSSRIRSAWLTVDQGDDDLGRFLAYLVAALQQIQPEVGVGLLANFPATRPPSPPTLATWLINDLVTILSRFVLVVDDYHTITAQPVHDFLAFLIDHQPSQMCLVIVSRADPPLPVARLRARGQLVELRQDELCFTLAESAKFINDVIGLNLNPGQLARLEKRTEGWVAGLQLAALSMRNVQDLPSFIESFSGDYEHIADYLTDEVLAQQPEPLKIFLLQTSILDRLTASLCEAVTGQVHAQETLEKLKEANLFIIPLDHQQMWFRYHALFADLLRKRLHQTQGEMVSELHRRASQWYQDHAILAPAVEHALIGRDDAHAAHLIAQAGESILKRNEAMTLLRWLEALSTDQHRANPILFVFHGLALLLCGRPPDTAKTRLDESATSGILDGLRGEIATFEGLLAIMKSNPAQAIHFSEQALQQLAPERAFFRSLAVETLGMAHTLLGDTTAAAKAFEQVVEIAEQTGNWMMAINALSNLAGLHILHGQLHAAADAYQQVLDLATEQMGKRSPITGKALLGLGMLSREWNDLERAQTYYVEATEMLAQSVEIGLPLAYLSLAMVKGNQGDWEAAQELLEKARHSAQASTATSLDDRLVEETQARFWIAQNRLDPAMKWAQSSGFLEQPFGESLAPGDARAAASLLMNQVTYLTLARLHLAMRQPGKALKILNPMLDLFQIKGYMRRVIEVLALKSMALKQQGNIEPAVQVLDQALGLAMPEGYQRTFLDEGEPMAQLLYQVAVRGDHPVYAGKLLAAFASESEYLLAIDRKTSPVESLVEPLSERELDVLALIAKGLSNREIAGGLNISLSTVKSHTAHIYDKLNANNRTQAVARARSLGLIPIL
jgi:LuxR family maltose regulon positive regulatory protein